MASGVLMPLTTFSNVTLGPACAAEPNAINVIAAIAATSFSARIMDLLLRMKKQLLIVAALTFG
jgi:hypothetical protein